MRTKICTSIEQSKKLIELEIDVKTADMYYLDDHYNVVSLKTNFSYENYLLYKGDIVDYIPAWSLSALLELIPTDDKKDEYYVDTESHSDYHTVSYRNCWDGCIHSEYSEESLLDAAFGMVVWLKENNKL